MGIKAEPPTSNVGKRARQASSATTSAATSAQVRLLAQDYPARSPLRAPLTHALPRTAGSLLGKRSGSASPGWPPFEKVNESSENKAFLLPEQNIFEPVNLRGRWKRRRGKRSGLSIKLIT